MNFNASPSLLTTYGIAFLSVRYPHAILMLSERLSFAYATPIAQKIKGKYLFPRYLPFM